MEYVSGLVRSEEGFFHGHIGFEEGIIVEIGKGEREGAAASGIIIPTLVNAHTHIADYMVPVDPALTLEELVAPPNGLKHRMLDAAPEEKLIDSMRIMKQFMVRRGVSHFVDFREGGLEGSVALRSLDDIGGTARIMGRPRSMEFCRQGIRNLLRIADGIAVSSITDWDYSELEKLSEEVRADGKDFAIHASEREREDIDKVLDLKPSFLVHMTKATEDDVEKVVEEDIPIVACPRSNMLFGRMPPLRMMLDKGATVALGTDNAMFCMPDMLSEIEFASRLLRFQGHRDLGAALLMAENGRIIINRHDSFKLEPGARCELMVLRHGDGDPIADLVLRSASENPALICIGNRIWR